MASVKLYIGEDFKSVRSDGYNFDFCRRTGKFARWGRTKEDDPESAPFPEIMDIELSTVCNGIGKPCGFCYKSNGPEGVNMTLGTYLKLFRSFPPGLTQIAFGIGDIDANPDLFRIIEATRDFGVVPNITVNGARMDYHAVSLLAKLCGAVAVSHYGDDSLCFGAVARLRDAGCQQVNIHKVLCEDTYDECMRLAEKVAADPRLAGLNALLFLWLKPKGRGIGARPLTDMTRYKALVDRVFALGLRIGFDSCSCPMFVQAIQDRPDKAEMLLFSESCESSLFSWYCNARGEYFPCSFCEGQPGWERGIDGLTVENFARDVWNHPRTVAWRAKLIDSKDANGQRCCPAFDLGFKGTQPESAPTR